MIGKSTCDFFISMLGLSRLGHAVLLLSPRLAIPAFVSLLEKTQCRTIVHTTEYQSTVQRIQNLYENIQTHLVLNHDDFDEALADQIELDVDPTSSGDRVAYIMHSSGTTGMPKPIFQSHQACLENSMNGYSHRALNTAPLYHTFGFASVFRTISMRGMLYMYDHNLPLTSDHLVAALKAVKPDVFFGVPYALKLLADSAQGIPQLRSCQSVIVAGSACPDELGNLLVNHGVHLIVLYGTTECGQMAASRRPKGDESWNYLRFYPNAKPYVNMKQVSDTLFELIVLDGYKSKVMSNSDDPPRSFHSRDLFSPHPTIPDAWKYISRIDDRVTLINGEKVLPLPIEGRIRSDPLVAEAVVFGIQRDFPGLLAFRGIQARDFSDEDFIEKLWPTIQDANFQAEGFSQIRKDVIIPVAYGVSYPCTDKGTILRASVYQLFEQEINSLYNRLQRVTEGAERLDLPHLQDELVRICQRDLGLDVSGPDTNMFNIGMDSLRAMQFSSVIRRRFDLGGRGYTLTADAIYRNASISRLAKYILALAGGQETLEDTDLLLMSQLIQKYSDFKTCDIGARPLVDPQNRGQTVILTGATGSLGCHILKILLEDASVDQIVCIVRVPDKNTGTSAEQARERILKSLRARELDLSREALSKLVPMAKDLSQLDFESLLEGSQEAIYAASTIIHTAWPVDFNFSLETFEPHLASLSNLIKLSLSVHQAPAKLLFCSSISTALGTPGPATIHESVIQEPLQAQKTGYARSKFCAEHILHQAATRAGADTIVARIGQIIGDNEKGIWNSGEAIPLMVRSATVVGALPDLKGVYCQWLPVDECARAICEMVGLTSNPAHSQVSGSREKGAQFLNVLHRHPFSWSGEVLPALRQAGLEFKIVPKHEWPQLLASSNPDPTKNPSIKLLDFWTRAYGKDSERHSSTRDKERIVFSLENAKDASVTLRESADPASTGLLRKIASRWVRQWT
jgi:thioester reductase-like protein